MKLVLDRRKGSRRAHETLASQLPADQQKSLLGEALAAARHIADAYNRARALTELAPQLPADQQEPVFGEALAAARHIPNAKDQAQALVALVLRLPADLALTTARHLPEYHRARALEALVPHLPTDLLGEALAAARHLTDECDRAQALVALVPQLPAEQQEPVFGEVLDAARYLTDEWTRAGELAALLAARPSGDVKQYAAWVVASGEWAVSRIIASPEYRDSVLGLASGGPGAPSERDSLEEQLRVAFAKVVPGHVVFNPPSAMRQGTKEQIEVRVVRSRRMDEALCSSLRGRGALILEEIPTSLVMEVALVGDAFTITQYNNAMQIVLNEQPTSWKFDLVGRQPGKQNLAVRVSMLLPLYPELFGGRDCFYDFRVLETFVQITISPSYFVKEHWQWVVGTGIVLGAGVGAWIKLF